MNKKQLVIAAMVAIFSVTSASASDITGITGVNGVFDITPDQINGDVGYRQYDNFTLSQGDIANLIFEGIKNGSIRNIEAFVNLVQNKIDINGIVNSMRDGKFHNGHAIFISPNGMTIGASGVLNVGTLSVATPTQQKYNELLNGYKIGDFTDINQISKLKQDSNAAINVAGKIFARNGVDLRGSAINVSGDILNGVTTNDQITSAAQAETLFNSLVNTDGIVKAGSAVANGSLILLKSDDKAGAGINITGRVANNDNGGVYVTNHGDNGLTVGGKISANGKVSLYNTNGSLKLTNGALANATETIALSNAGDALELANNTTVNGKNVEIVNNGTDNMAIAGLVKAANNGKIDIVNHEAAGALNITGQVGQGNEATTRIINKGDSLALASTGTIKGQTVTLRNKGVNGMTLNGNVNGNNISVNNSAGALAIGGTLNSASDMVVYNTGDSLGLTSTGKINAKGNLAVKNTGSEGMTLDGTITNVGETAINNLDGQLLVNGTINNTGNMGIINQGVGTSGNDLTITKNAVITNTGDLKIANNGENGTAIIGSVDNTGNLYIYNDAGKLKFATDSTGTKAATITNRNGDLHIAGRKASEGIVAASATKISNENGVLAIRNKGTGVLDATKGLDLQGTITNNGNDIAINNDTGNLYVSGNIEVTNGNLGIINRAEGESMTLASAGNIKVTGGNANIKNNGTGNMEVNSTITHDGRVNVIANNGALELGSAVTNNSGALSENGGFYATTRQNGTGINATNTFAVTGDGEVLIKNISGKDGLRFNGTINTTNNQAALVNKDGKLEVLGDITTTKAPVILSNFGTGLDVTTSSALTSDTEVRIVNTGSEKANLSGTITAPNGRVLYEQLKQAE